MKKYKLIQTYPESPAMNTKIVHSILHSTMVVGVSKTRETFLISVKDKHWDNGVFRIDNPWLYPKNWEEIIEPAVTYPVGTQAFDSAIPDSLLTKTVDGWYNTSKTSYTDKIVNQRKNITILKPKDKKDYEILSFKDMLNNLITKKEGKFLTSYHETEYKEERLIKKCEIHSVKRLSDGEVFTVDDDFTSKEGSKFKIRRFQWIIGGLKLEVVNNTTGGYHSLLDIQLTKKPLFTTEDGVDIFEGDKSCWVDKNFCCSNVTKYCGDLGKSVKYFSTKKVAEEYILLNISKLCINDIMDVTDTNNEMALKDFKKLVKKKIDGN